MIPFTLPDFTDHEEMECFVDALREERDRLSWFIGAIADRHCVDRPAGGRPAPNEYTTSKLAYRIHEKAGFVSECRNNWKFYHDIIERVPESVSWRECADARRRSGWRPGVIPTAEQQRNALGFLIEAESGHIAEAKDPRPHWRRRLDRACELLSAIEGDAETPALVRLAIRTLLGQVTVRPLTKRRFSRPWG